MKTPKFEIGDKVAYSVQFLKSIGMSHSDMARARGIVRGKKEYGGGSLVLIEIDWDCDMPDKVAAGNLAKVGANRRFCNVD